MNKALSGKQIAAKGLELSEAKWELPKRYRLQSELLALPDEELKAKDPVMHALWTRTKQEQARLAANAALPHSRPSSQEMFRAQAVQRAEEVRVSIADLDKQIVDNIVNGGGDRVDELREAKRALRHKRAGYLATMGRFDLAFETEPDPRYRGHYLAVLDAIYRDDGDHCGHPDTQGSGEHANVTAPSWNAKEDVWSPRHGRMVTVMSCNKCGFLNAIDAPAHVREMRSHRVNAMRIAGKLTMEEAAKALTAKGHTTAKLLKK